MAHAKVTPFDGRGYSLGAKSCQVTGDRPRPVLILDGAAFSDFEGFQQRFSEELLDDHEWRGNLDAFNDILRGGFGTPDAGWTLRWINSDRSRTALGHQATADRLNGLLDTCHPSNRRDIGSRLEEARQGKGPNAVRRDRRDHPSARPRRGRSRGRRRAGAAVVGRHSRRAACEQSSFSTTTPVCAEFAIGAMAAHITRGETGRARSNRGARPLALRRRVSCCR